MTHMRTRCDRCGRTWSRDALGKQCRRHVAGGTCGGTFVLIDESDEALVRSVKKLLEEGTPGDV